jgi:hypothetical protein
MDFVVFAILSMVSSSLLAMPFITIGNSGQFSRRMLSSVKYAKTHPTNFMMPKFRHYRSSKPGTTVKEPIPSRSALESEMAVILSSSESS